MKLHRLAVASLACVAVLGIAPAAGGQAPAIRHVGTVTRPLRVLVTNDDGVGAPGIDAVVQVLRAVPGIDVTVVAPATNQSGQSDKFSTTPLTVTPATTMHGYPATAVAGFPSDTVWLAVLKLLPQRPDLVVAGVNFGQNIGDLTSISGTVGAARTAARLGISAIAVSQGFSSNIDYTLAANLTSFFAQSLRPKLLAHPHRKPTVYNVNVPSCATGAVRGVVSVPLGRQQRVTGYTQSAPGTYTPTVQTRDLANSDCTSTEKHPTDDIDAFEHGFVSLSKLATN
jgi:5'/3'-nucleotidase